VRPASVMPVCLTVGAVLVFLGLALGPWAGFEVASRMVSEDASVGDSAVVVALGFIVGAYVGVGIALGATAILWRWLAARAERHEVAHLPGRRPRA
jgi:hypothetical protein